MRWTADVDSVWQWIVIGALVWAVLSLVLGVVLGRAMRLADRVEAEVRSAGSTSPGAPAPRVPALHVAEAS